MALFTSEVHLLQPCLDPGSSRKSHKIRKPVQEALFVRQQKKGFFLTLEARVLSQEGYRPCAKATSRITVSPWTTVTFVGV